ncbi:tetratricopeptide repeat protein [Halovivax sp.]|uniref:tetratricopeptide repeat protein n=1 Tax=Halovivax sp. TaxID=1935978 RepID=UPI0025C05EFB|nr:tetratricopeptide repeat protein [Halovivax sp.]
MDVPDPPDEVEVVVKRIDFLECLADGPLHKPDLEDRLDHSRSTVDRAIGALEEAGFVERGPGGWVRTQSGRLAAERYRRFVDHQRQILEASPVLDAISDDESVPSALLDEATVVTEDAKTRLVETVADELRRANRYRLLLPETVDARHLRTWHKRTSRDGIRVDLVGEPDVLSAISEEFPELSAELADIDAVSVTGAAVPGYGLLIPSRNHEEEPERIDDGGSAGTSTVRRSERAETPTCAILVAFEGGELAGFVASGADEAIEWAIERFETVRRNGRDGTATLRNERARDELSFLWDDRLPVTLRSQGFSQLDEDYFDSRESLDPVTGWRAGLGLAEVAEGYAIHRTVPLENDDGHIQLTEHLRNRLSEAGNVAIVGPPGSGKSTVCKQVACEWRNRTGGTVYYRESGVGRPFEAVALLERVLERSAGPTLVVLEDAVRPAANDVFRAIDAFAGRDDVSFLLDARSTEWGDPDGFPDDPRLEAVRHEAVETVTIPPVDGRICERLVEHLETLTGESVPVAPDDLFASIRSGADDVAPAGTMLTICHRLSLHADPIGEFQDDGASVLDASVDRVRAELASLGDRAVDVGVLVNLLNVAGLGVYPAYVYAVGVDRGSDADGAADVREALERLEGSVLFAGADGSRYDAVHETWSARYLERFLEDAGSAAAERRFGRCVSALLSLADEPERRERVFDHVEPSAVHESLRENAFRWADETTVRVFDAGRTYRRLPPLYGTTEGSHIAIPDACSTETELQCIAWRGEMHLSSGSLEDAESEFELLKTLVEELSDADAPSRATLVGFRVDSLLGRARIAMGRGELERATERARTALDRASDVGRRRDEAKARYTLGLVAKRADDPEAATNHLSACLETVDELSWSRMQAAVLVELGRVAEMRGREDRAFERLQAALELYRSIGDRRGEADAHRLLGSVLTDRGDYDGAREHYHRGLELAETVGDRELVASSLRFLGALATKTGDLELADRYDERGLAVAREAEATAEAQRLLVHRGGNAMFRGELETAEELLCCALEDARELGSSRREARVYERLSYLHSLRYEHERSIELARRARELAADAEHRRLEVRTILTGCRGLTAIGSVSEADEWLADAQAIVSELDQPEKEADLLIWRAETAKLLGDLDRAERYARRSIELHDVVGRIEANGNARLGEIALERGEYDAAADRFADAIDVYRERGLRQGALRYTVWLARAQRRGGARDEAEASVEDVLETARDEDDRWLEGRALVERGCLARDRGRPADGAADVVRGVEILRSLGVQFDAALALADLGRLERERGDHEAARAFLTDATELFLELGTDHRSERVAGELIDVCEELGETDVAAEWAERVRGRIGVGSVGRDRSASEGGPSVVGDDE